MNGTVFRILSEETKTAEVSLVPMKSKGDSWWVQDGDQRAGKVSIGISDYDTVGKVPAIKIFLNKKSQGRGVGRAANRLAVEASGRNRIYANLRKSNTASRRALEAAGFKDVTPEGYGQRLMRWDKK